MRTTCAKSLKRTAKMLREPKQRDEKPLRIWRKLSIDSSRRSVTRLNADDKMI